MLMLCKHVHFTLANCVCEYEVLPKTVRQIIKTLLRESWRINGNRPEQPDVYDSENDNDRVQITIEFPSISITFDFNKYKWILTTDININEI